MSKIHNHVYLLESEILTHSIVDSYRVRREVKVEKKAAKAARAAKVARKRRLRPPSLLLPKTSSMTCSMLILRLKPLLLKR